MSKSFLFLAQVVITLQHLQVHWKPSASPSLLSSGVRVEPGELLTSLAHGIMPLYHQARDLGKCICQVPWLNYIPQGPWWQIVRGLAWRSNLAPLSEKWNLPFCYWYTSLL